MRDRWTWTLAAVLTLGTDVAASGDLKRGLDEVAQAQAVAHQRFLADLEGTNTDEAQKPAVDRYEREVARNADKALDLVRANPADPAVLEALRFVIETARGGPGEQSERAMELLLRDHVGDSGMGLLCGKLFAFRHSLVAEELIRAVLEKHPNREDRALACHSLALCLDFRAQMVREVRQGTQPIDRYVSGASKDSASRLIKASDPTALDREVDILLERLIADYADVKDWYTPKRTLGAIAEGELFARRNLSVGQVAPEVVGKDHEGKTFALGDYRGKVVVLSFGASWCGPCVGMYPQERELVQKLSGEPFAMVSVNADEDVATLKKAIASGEITWRCWWDGGMDGPITTRWGVVSIPAVFVLDRAGVIRNRDVRGVELEKAVMTLLAEKATTSPVKN